MKNVILFVAIFMVFGGLMKAPVYRMCKTSVVCKYYYKGDLLRTEESESGWSSSDITVKTRVQSGEIIQADSISYEPKYTTYRMLDN